MKLAWSRGVAVAALLGTAVVACDDNPLDAPQEETARLRLSRTTAVVNAGDTLAFEAVALNAYGATTLAAVEVSACSEALTIIEDTSRVNVQPPNGVLIIGESLGTTCVVAQSGGVSDTMSVQVVPASMAATVTPGTILSGETGQIAFTFFDIEGETVTGMGVADFTFASDDEAIGSIDDNGVVTAKAPGNGTVVASLDPALYAAEREVQATFSVIPGTFNGTASPASAEALDTIVFAGGSGEEFDDDTDVVIGGVHPFAPIAINPANNSIEVLAPYGIGAGDVEFIVTGIGADQIAKAGTITYTADNSNDPYEQPTDGTATAPAVPFPVDIMAYSSGSDINDYFEFSVPAPTTVRVFMEWVTAANGDLDLFVLDASGGSVCTETVSPNIPEEDPACDLPSAGTYYIWMNNWDADAHGNVAGTNYHIVVEPN